MKTNLKSVATAFIFTLTGAAAGYAVAQSGSHVTGHGHIAPSSAGVPTQAGQSAFSAIAEIVTMLENDPNTDWSSVNINTLRAHLVDMDELILNSTVVQRDSVGSIEFKVTGQDRTVKAIQSMVPAHARELAKMPDWKVEVSKMENGAILRVSGSGEATQAKIKALGFYGLMTIGAHHQPHHLAMATGKLHGH